MALLWAAAESLWRVTDPRFDTRLDALRRHQLSPQIAQALTWGIGFGLLTAALSVGTLCTASLLPGIRLSGLSVDLPIAGGTDGPLGTGFFLASASAFLIAAARRFGTVRCGLAATLVGAIVLSPVHLEPWHLECAAAVPILGLLVVAGLTGGPLTLLTAALVSQLVPAAVFSGEHWAFMPGSFTLTAGLLLAIVVTAAICHFRQASATDA